MSDLLIARFFDFLLYDQIKAGLLKSAKEAIYPLTPDFSNSDLVASYERLVFASQDVYKNRQAGLSGLPLPALALWRSTEPKIPKDAYGRSVLKREIYVPPSTPEANDSFYTRAPIIDWEFEYHIYAESYFSTYVSRVSQDLVQFDMARYVNFDLSDYVRGMKTKAELRVGEVQRSTAMTEAGGVTRKFMADIPITLKVTVPLMGSNFAIEQLLIYLNGHKVYELNTP